MKKVFNIGDTVKSVNYGGSYIVCAKIDFPTKSIKMMKILLIEKKILDINNHSYHIINVKINYKKSYDNF